MADSVTLRVGTYNLRDGGLDGASAARNDARLKAQLTMLATLRLDLLGLQEAKWGSHGHVRLEQVARWLGMTWKCLVRSNFHGCDIAVLVREGDGIAVTRERHLIGPPFTHAHADVELQIAGRTRPVRFMVGHAAPSSPTLRLAEAELIGVYRNIDVVYAADFNAAALNEDPDVQGVDPLHVARKLDTRPAEELQASGFIDIGAHLGDRTPTVGHTRSDRLAYRCDRIYTTLPRGSITGHRVVQEHRPLSDHRPVWAELTLPLDGAGDIP
ncbi:endonuclease/exonuclease/phosphatase family protein [Actinomadura sp. WMMB 499]|uniref:endonuclease/exonuclease/phosphatase family protein n=1 Tax=Actinomadura sp. WMMB 499 TaxID=1219491 RepID=UPI001246C607|nr:endonuclease/exonuclease/phosphatase family protein [Actinomadura sp. WMMB 499]QFG22864.1 hypothetical protein F7P10_18820 [Actinomadura sp. WMMB 499]